MGEAFAQPTAENMKKKLIAHEHPSKKKVGEGSDNFNTQHPSKVQWKLIQTKTEKGKVSEMC